MCSVISVYKEKIRIKMGRSGCFYQTREDCAFNHCLVKFRDEHGNPSNIRTTTVIPVTTTDLPYGPTSRSSTILSNDTDLPYGPTSRSSTILSNDTDMIVGIVVSVTVIILTIVVILVFMYRRKYSKEQLSLSTIGTGDRDTTEMYNNTITSDNELLENVDNIDKSMKACDEMHVICVEDSEQAKDQSNTSNHDESIEETNEIYENTVILEYKQLDNAKIDKSTKTYDPLHVTHAIDTDQTSYKSKTIISTEEHSDLEPTEETTEIDNKTVTSVYEPLDNDIKDKSPKAYDKLHVAHEVDTDPSNYPNTMFSSEEQSNYEPIDETTEVENKTATTEYKQLDNVEEDKSMNVYNQ